MRVLLVGPDLEANLSLLYLSSSLRAAGHEPAIAPFNGWDDAPSVIAAARGADLVGLSMCFQVRASEFLALADALKQDAPGRPVVAGGHHASCAAVELLEHHPALDAIVLHEGEDSLAELAALGGELVPRAGEVSGVAHRRGGRVTFSAPRPIREELDSLPRPDRSGPARLLCGVPTAYLMGSRGCVSDCDYCCITTLHRLVSGPRFRQRSPEDVADEMAELYHRRGVRQFVFHDDNFLVPSQAHNRARIDAIDGVLKARGVRDVGLVLKCSPRDAERATLERLRDMGLLRLFMGIESASACGLASIGRRQTVAQNERALETTEALGISTQYTLIIFHPEATIASMLDDLAFAARHPAHPLNYCRAEVYSGTPLEARMLAAGRAEGSYLGRTYRYTDPQVASVWEAGRDLFAGRCWGQDELLGKVIRIDHQVAVLGHFYEGRKVRELVRSFLGWEVDLNLETAGLFRELVVACGDARGSDDPALARAVEGIRRREAPSREARLRELCSYREALDRFANASVASGRRLSVASPASRRRMPRHAAAVAAAIGMFGCAVAHDRGIQEAPPPPMDRRPPPVPPSPPAAQQPAPGDPPPPPQQGPWVPVPDPATDFVRDEGVAEAAPPPFDEPEPVKPPYLHDRGVAEAAPPPYLHDHGVAEAAPPPYDRYRPALSAARYDVRTTPAVPLAFRGHPVSGPQRLAAGDPPLFIGDATTPIRATVRILPRGPEATVRVESAQPLSVTFEGKGGATPWSASLPRREGAPVTLLLSDPATAARVVVRLTLLVP
ncbi:MAG TPA: cobalamin-dependent protein [Anaeromyxobacteraceae bacterium]|nr:cobalamin-dependent protein [Anaeromyxobacteraceae bacterium]